MAGGLTVGYGTFAVIAARFLYPTKDESLAWQFVALADEFAVGDSREFVSPSGAKVVIARQGEGATADDFIALSSVCPHLGCQVHWEAQNNRFYCPCHNGTFDPQGKATGGPPGKAKQQLIRFQVNVENNMLFILAPVKSIT
jgi:Rieske Fe-S protein